MTITTYSNKVLDLTDQNEIKIITESLPDLINALVNNKIINEEIAKSLMRQYESRYHEIPLILQAYIYISTNPHKQIKENKRKCL